METKIEVTPAILLAVSDYFEEKAERMLIEEDRYESEVREVQMLTEEGGVEKMKAKVRALSAVRPRPRGMHDSPHGAVETAQVLRFEARRLAR